MPRTKKIPSPESEVILKPVKEQAHEIKVLIESVQPAIAEKPARKKRILSEEQKEALRERLVKARAVRAAKKSEKI